MWYFGAGVVSVASILTATAQPPAPGLAASEPAPRQGLGASKRAPQLASSESGAEGSGPQMTVLIKCGG